MKHTTQREMEIEIATENEYIFCHVYQTMCKKKTELDSFKDRYIQGYWITRYAEMDLYFRRGEYFPVHYLVMQNLN